MYVWYHQAKICLAYLADVPTTDDVDAPDSKFVSSRWYGSEPVIDSTGGH